MSAARGHSACGTPAAAATSASASVVAAASCVSGCQEIKEIGYEVDEKHERVVCMHINPLLFQLLVFLCKGFAQHFLVELSNRWSASIEHTVKK